ncbi:unnamed protein product [Cuscuta campestris]|uniref:Alliinase C-terminal domain-containing protein n=1 Tax=Cuscuta campestris TaxID=132261 RepID=A0A484MFX2_9ASTE|nr:unnamed protein product [Cuscuta campestris]
MGATVKASPANFAAENGENGAGKVAVLNLAQGDPTMFGAYWEKMSEKGTIAFTGAQSMSYYSNTKSICWFLEPELEKEIRRLHGVVGNAVEEEHYVVVGTGSSQLIQAALYALSPPDADLPVNVVCAAPYYSSYPEVADIVRSRSYKWGGDARKYDRDEPYIELVTTPNNPDGAIREPVVNKPQGTVIYDLAYYWPNYTAISSAADHDLMLFTFSKCTGHAGSRIGWALVRDKEVAKKMIKYMEVSTIGVSKDSQLRAAKILGVVSDSCCSHGAEEGFEDEDEDDEEEDFFSFSRNILRERWQRLSQLVKAGNLFTLQKYPTQYCHFAKDMTDTLPAFAWIRMTSNEGGMDCAELLKEQRILARSGTRFGVDNMFARVSMVSTDEEFNTFLQRLAIIQGTSPIYI